MFQHTHAYLASKLYDSEDSLLLIGSILPDLAITGVITWDEGLHGPEPDQNFQQFISENYPKYTKLAEGVHAHNIIDDFTHLNYNGKTGYAYQNNKELMYMIGQFYELDEEKSKGKAHNFIESGVDILLLQTNPEIQKKLKNASKEISIEKISQILSEYFKTDKTKMLESLTNYLDLFTKYDFSEKESWISFWTDLEKLLKLKPIVNGKREQLLNKALKVTKNTYKEFLDYTIRKGTLKI